MCGSCTFFPPRCFQLFITNFQWQCEWYLPFFPPQCVWSAVTERASFSGKQLHLPILLRAGGGDVNGDPNLFSLMSTRSNTFWLLYHTHTLITILQYPTYFHNLCLFVSLCVWHQHPALTTHLAGCSPHHRLTSTSCWTNQSWAPSTWTPSSGLTSGATSRSLKVSE